MRHVQPICHRAGNHFWSGSCLRGRLHGAGVLIWFEDGVETERDEGTFRNGELDGPSVITLADRTTIFGNYRDGVRHGEFMIVQTSGITDEEFEATKAHFLSTSTPCTRELIQRSAAC